MITHDVVAKRVGTETTVDLVASGTASGSQSPEITMGGISFVAVYVKTAFKFAFAADSDAAVTAFATSASHGKRPAGFHIITCRGETNSLWLEADTASANVTDGLSYETYEV